MTTRLLLSSSSLSSLTAFRSDSGGSNTARSVSLLPSSSSARVSLNINDVGSAAAAARGRCFSSFRYNGVSFNGFSATSSPPQFAVRNQADETTEPMRCGKTFKIFSGTPQPKGFQDIASLMGPDFKIKAVKGCGKNVELPDDVEGCHVYLLHHICSPSYKNNNKEFLYIIDACKAGGATDITVVMTITPPPFVKPKNQGMELFNLVKDIACKVAPDHGDHEIFSFDFNPTRHYKNPAIDARRIMGNYLKYNNHESDLVIVTSQKSEGVDRTFKKDFQLVAIIHDEEDIQVEFPRQANREISTILVENIFYTNGGGDATFVHKNVYACDKVRGSVKFLEDAIISSVFTEEPDSGNLGLDG